MGQQKSCVCSETGAYARGQRFSATSCVGAREHGVAVLADNNTVGTDGQTVVLAVSWGGNHGASCFHVALALVRSVVITNTSPSRDVLMCEGGR